MPKDESWGADLPRLDLASPNLAEETKAGLRNWVPEAFDEGGRLDFGRLRELLGEFVDGDRTRYGLSWAGKQDAMRALLSQSVGTLVPVRGESEAFDETENLIIEGDNLEVLKLLQKSYYGKVKMIYIDPPYNTGNDFIYPDNFREGLQDYLKYSGQVSEEGFRTSSNTETSGRYHSNWLNMMYPRLALARNLLREDGVIFVSIDDHEAHNLRMLMDEVFGEENFVACVCWQKRYAPANDTVDFSAMHDFVIGFARGRALTDSGKSIAVLSRMERTEEQNKLYKNPDNDPRGLWASDNYICNKTAEQRRNLYFPIIHPKSGKEIWPDRSAVWRYSKERHARHVAENRVWWGLEQENEVPRYKRFLSEVRGVVADTWWPHTVAGHNDEAKKIMKAIFPETSVRFDTPKPPRLVKRLVSLATEADLDDIILDFFAGSGTTAQAVMELNQEDGGNRRFILVQLPEPLDPPIKLDKGPKLTTIADICRERVRRAAKKISVADAAKTPKLLEDGETPAKSDRGFRSFKLTSSNFKLWEDKTNGDPAKLVEQLKLYAENILPDRDPEAILFEILLKSGIELSAPIETIEIDGEPIFKIDGGRLHAYLNDPVDETALRKLIETGAEKIVCLDHGFRGNDALKANIVQQVKQWNTHHPDKPVDFRTV